LLSTAVKAARRVIGVDAALVTMEHRLIVRVRVLRAECQVRALLNNGYSQKPKRRLWAVRSVVAGFRGGPLGESPPLETL
jgi:hypothetical protein